MLSRVRQTGPSFDARPCRRTILPPSDSTGSGPHAPAFALSPFRSTPRLRRMLAGCEANQPSTWAHIRFIGINASESELEPPVPVLVGYDRSFRLGAAQLEKDGSNTERAWRLALLQKLCGCGISISASTDRSRPVRAAKSFADDLRIAKAGGHVR